MNLFGFELRRKPQAEISLGESFVARTIAARTAEILAATPHLPAMTTFNQPMNPSGGFSERLEDRAIASDPRENWYLTLPEKITPQQAVNIMRAALGGDIWQLHMLLQLMEARWPVFRMAAHQLREAAAYTKYVPHPYAEDGEEPTESAKEKAALVGRALKSFSPDQYSDEKGSSGMIYDFTHAMLMGVSLVELVWERKRHPKYGEEMLPRASAFVHPRHFTFSNTGKLCVYDQDYDRQYNDPRTQSRNPIIWNAEPDPDKFICSQFSSKSGSSLGAGFMLPIVWLFVARQWCNEWALNTAKQFGSPFIAVSYRPGQTDSEERAKLSAFLKNAGAERRLLHPEGTAAQVFPSQPMTADNPQRWLHDEADKQCLFLLLGQDSTTKSIPGQLGGQEAKQDVKEERVTALANWIARNPLRQFARAVLRQNYGDDSECPEFIPDRTRPLSSTEVGALASSINMSGLPVRADEFYKKIGFSQPEPGDVIVQRGEITEMLTEEEKYEQALAQQQDQIELQSQAGGQPPVEASQRKTSTDRLPVTTIRAALAKATPEQRKKLEEAVTAAERATHLNGEVKLVQKLIDDITRA